MQRCAADVVCPKAFDEQRCFDCFFGTDPFADHIDSPTCFFQYTANPRCCQSKNKTSENLEAKARERGFLFEREFVSLGFEE